MTAPPVHTSSESFILLNDLIVQPEFESLMRENNLTDVATLFELRESRGDDANKALRKPGLDHWRERLRINLRDDDATRICYLKRYDHAPRQARREIARSQSGAKSLAGIEWHWLNELKASGIPCATPIALGEQFDGTCEVRSAIVIAEVPGQSLEKELAVSNAVSRALIWRLIPPLAALIARFHAAGFVHRDLYLSHIFFDAQANDQTSLHLIDLQRVLRPRYFRERWIIKDLAALNYSAPSPLITRTDRLRWLKEYLSLSNLNTPARRLAYRVIGKTLSIARHDAARRRKLSI
ncbi:MAG: hypothetical protein HY287_02715 [Planctomycetes bacterium]|nr:hypothetical protein [Planctomycetota bacterium]MBI3833223.1 hypothetical protein [Planctomycetota bacterium]